jgi:acyl-CoA synthetase (AMP-forming)/AMP-acid ligase II
VAALRRHAEHRGDHPALTFVGFGGDGPTPTTMTYAELDRRARSVAAHLQAKGGVGRFAAVVGPQDLDFHVAFLGALYAGLAAVPLQQPEVFGSTPRVAAALPALERLRTAFPDTRAAEVVAVDRMGDDAADRWVQPAIHGGTLAYLQYTSGSTSAPRGVLVSHANIAHSTVQCGRALGLGADSVGVSWLPLFHDMGLAFGATVPLLLGVPTVLTTPFAVVQRPARWLALLSRYRATVTGSPNFGLEMCVSRISADDLRDVDLSSVTMLLNGSETVRAETLSRFTAAFARHGFSGSAHLPAYGLAEATVLVTSAGHGRAPRVLRCDRDALGRGVAVPVAAGGHALVECGRAVGQRVEVVDPQELRALAPQRIGEIWVQGPNVTGGYHGRPEQTAEAFGARLDGTPGTWLRTGDLGFLHEGRLYLTGRIKDLIIIDGRNHYPNDIESTVETAGPAVRAGHVAAFSVPGDRTEQLVVVTEVHGDPAGLAAAVRRAVAVRHGIAVHDVVAAPRGSVPRTSSGKVSRSACRTRYLDGGFGPDHHGHSGSGGR